MDLDHTQTDENARPSGPVLLPLSPERMNQQKPVITSPDPQLKQPRAASEVQAKIAFLNSLENINAPTSTSTSTSASPLASAKQTPTAAALQRAILGREEAEAALRKTQRSLLEAQERELKLSQRLEALSQETHNLKEKQAKQREHDRAILQKEIKSKTREAFLNSSALIDRLVSAHEETRAVQEELQQEKQAREKAELSAIENELSLQEANQEAKKLRTMIQSLEHDNRADELEKKCKVAEEESLSLQAHVMELEQTAKGLERQISRSKEQITTLEEDLKIERDAHERTVAEHLESNNVVGKLMREINELREQLHTTTDELNARNEDLAQERQKALRRSRTGTPQHGHNRSSLASKLRESARFSPRITDSPGSNFSFLTDSDIDSVEKLRQDLSWEKRLRRRAEDMIEYMKLECQFQLCSCRIAEQRGSRYVYDAIYDRRHRSEILKIDGLHSSAELVHNDNDVHMDTQPDEPEIKHENSGANDSGLELSIPNATPPTLQQKRHSPSHSPRTSPRHNVSVRQVTPDQEADLEFLPESGTFRKIINGPQPFRQELAPTTGSRKDDVFELERKTSPTRQYQLLPSGHPVSQDQEMPTGRRALTSMSQYADVQMDENVPPVPSLDTPHFLPKEGIFKAKRYHPAPPPRRFRIEKEKQMNATKEEHHERQHFAHLTRELSEEPVDFSHITHNASITSSRSHPALGSSRHHHTDDNQPPSLPRHHSQPPPVPNTPLSINREEALAQIRARRERAAQQRSKSANSNSRPNTAAGHRSGEGPPTAGKRRTRDDEFERNQPGNGRSKRHIGDY
ncbi:hypothetical protein KEM56_001274 [Ascosphaera pollenicola]|nr:hypothetical protein KEM56_001274 [Ascosphaera pollenicola]